MKNIIRGQRGFSLIEIIASLVIVAVLAAVVGLSVVNLANSFIFAKTNTETFQKGQIALARIVKELNNIQTVASANATSIVFTSYRDGSSHTVSLNGANILVDGVILTDDINSFALAYYDNYNTAPQITWTSTRRIIEITLVINGAEGTTSTFNARIAPSFI